MLSLDEICFAGMEAVAKGLSGVGAGKYILRARKQLQRKFQVLAPGEMCFEGMEQLERGLEVLVLGEICF